MPRVRIKKNVRLCQDSDKAPLVTIRLRRLPTCKVLKTVRCQWYEIDETVEEMLDVKTYWLKPLFSGWVGEFKVVVFVASDGEQATRAQVLG